ncbi:MAG: hypothetical protein PHQ34_07090 [Methanothrix sp.]|nr:hypothetical protein [Methanothrix sp.]
MTIISLLVAFAVFSLIFLPACSQPILNRCACVPDRCPEMTRDNCCSQSSGNSVSMSCACSGQIASYSGGEYCDICNSQFSSRSSARGSSAGMNGSRNSGLLCPVLPISRDDTVGPPDLDVVKYLPPSAKQVFQLLASEGPLTQKDIISRTDLPPRTVRYALERLRGEEMLKESFCFRDARQSLYYLYGMDVM